MNDLRIGVIISHEGEAYEVTKSEHVKMGRGQAVMRTKLRHLVTGNTLEHTFKTNDKIEEANLTRSKASYLYADEESLHFMDQKTFEQFFIPVKALGDKASYLKDGLLVDVLVLNDLPITVQLPKKVDYLVKDAPPGVKGDTATNVFKTVILENDLQMKVPLFINKGDSVRINTETEEYVERA